MSETIKVRPMPVKREPAEVRALFLATLRQHNYTGKTTEIAQWAKMHSSVVRRAGLALAKESKIEAVLVPGRGKGEYRFTITQLDLFEDAKRPGSWVEIPLQKGSGIWNSFKKMLRF